MKYINKTSGSIRLATLLFGAALLGLVSQNALAVGTAVGTSITNSALLTYTVGGIDPTGGAGITATSTAFVVDAKINLTVGGGIVTSVVPGSTLQATAFTVTNFSNTDLDFSLAANAAIAGDNFDPTACSVFVESGATLGYQAAQDTATFVDELVGDGVTTATVYAVCNIPLGLVNGNTGLVGLIATARGNFTGVNGTYVPTTGPAVLGNAITATVGAETPGTVDIVFADVAGTDDSVGARDAQHSARNTYTISSAVLTISKTAALLCDTLNGVTSPKNIPGAITQWTITVSNAGPGAATLTSITDTLPASLVHDANLVVPALLVCDSATGTPASGAGLGFQVTAPVGRAIGACASPATSCFFTTGTADGLDIAGQAITATFSTILPVDAGTGHATAGLLNSGESVSIIFNTTVQ